MLLGDNTHLFVSHKAVVLFCAGHLSIACRHGAEAYSCDVNDLSLGLSSQHDQVWTISDPRSDTRHWARSC